jgi:hypothetical protein
MSRSSPFPHPFCSSAMSSSSATATASRSPSPLTPESSDSLEQVAVHNDFELSSWYHSLRNGKSFTNQAPWDSPLPTYSDPAKTSDEHMLCFNDLIDEHAYDEYAHSQCLTLLFNKPISLQPGRRLPSSTIHHNHRQTTVFQHAPLLYRLCIRRHRPSLSPISLYHPIPRSLQPNPSHPQPHGPVKMTLLPPTNE